MLLISGNFDLGQKVPKSLESALNLTHETVTAYYHGMLPADANYHQAQQSIHRGLDRDAGVYNEFHALLVEVGKRHCRLQGPRCGGCPLEEFLPEGELRPRTTAV